MPWRIRWLPPAERDLAGLERHIAKRVIAKLIAVAEDPLRFFSRLTNREEYKLRVGDYRVLAILIPRDQLIFIQTIEHRSTAYRKR